MSEPESTLDAPAAGVGVTTDAFPNPEEAPNVRYNPSRETLRELASHDETTTEYESPSYTSVYKSRSADRTKNALDDAFTKSDWEHIGRAVDSLPTEELVCLDRLVGRHPEHSYCCRLFLPAEYARIALAWSTMLEPAPEGREPDFYTVQLPDWEETRIRVLPEEGITFVLGSDYTGEAKKSFLRLFMLRAKQKGGLGLHAGTKCVTVEGDDGELRDVEQVFLGLSGTGKSTLTGHNFRLEEPERSSMLQDDVCALLPDGSLAGSEGAGLYIKTDGLDEDHQPTLYRAATRPDAVLENVWVEDDGTVDFDNDELTANGRAVVRREDVESADEEVDCDSADQLFFITRHPMVPPIVRLTPEQAAAAFMLGESIETSAGDPSRAGEPVRVVGTNPFIIGSKGEEGVRFRDLVVENDLDCFVINTGRVGPVDEDVGVDDTVAVLVGAARGDIDWEFDDQLGVEVPRSVPGIDVGRFLDDEAWAESREQLEAVRDERREYLAEFEDLDERIADSVY